MLKVTKMALPEVLLLEYPVRQDPRVSFSHTFFRDEMSRAGILCVFPEEITYHPFRKDTLYGIHFQNHPNPQSKLISCTHGRILDYAVDLRRDSPTYRQWLCVELAGGNRQLFIPAGFGHAALTLEDDSHIVMRIDKGFDPLLFRSIRYDDPALGIPFPVSAPILSEQDRAAPCLADSDCNL